MSEAILSCVIALSSCRLAVAMNESLTQLKDTTANPAPLGLLGFGMTTVLLNLHNAGFRSEEHTSELQSRFELVCRLLLEKKKNRGGSDPPPACRRRGPRAQRHAALVQVGRWTGPLLRGRGDAWRQVTMHGLAAFRLFSDR